jgi:hypothetical protein
MCMIWYKTSGKVKLIRDSGSTRRRTAVCTVLCQDAHQMHATADAGGDEDVRHLCALAISYSSAPAVASECARELRRLLSRHGRLVRTADENAKFM